MSLAAEHSFTHLLCRLLVPFHTTMPALIELCNSGLILLSVISPMLVDSEILTWDLDLGITLILQLWYETLWDVPHVEKWLIIDLQPVQNLVCPDGGNSAACRFASQRQRYGIAELILFHSEGYWANPLSFKDVL